MGGWSLKACFEVFDELGGGSGCVGPIVRGLGHERSQEVVERGSQAGDESGRWFGINQCEASDLGQRGIAREWGLAGEHLIEQAADTEDVGPIVAWPAFRDFRGRCMGAARGHEGGEFAGIGRLQQAPAEPDESSVIGGRFEKDGFRREKAMQKATIPAHRQCDKQFAGNAECGIGVEPAG